MRRNPVSRRPRVNRAAPGQAGTTLIEVMASSVILSLTFFAVVTMIRKAHDIEYDGNAFVQARGFANTVLELPRYHHTRYDDIPADSIYPSGQGRVIYADSNLVDVDLRVTATAANTVIDDWNGVSIPYKRLEAIVSWKNGAYSVSSSRRITKIP